MRQAGATDQGRSNLPQPGRNVAYIVGAVVEYKGAVVRPKPFILSTTPAFDSSSKRGRRERSEMTTPGGTGLIYDN